MACSISPTKTLAALIERLTARRGNNITVVLDYCHSGSGTRALRADPRLVTCRAPFDERRPPVDLDSAYRPGARTRAAGRSGWTATATNHVLIAGCLDREEAHEHDANGARHGALSFFLLQYLRQMPRGATYGDLHEYVRAHVNARYPQQTPQCEGQRDRAVFGGARIERRAFIPLRLGSDGRVRLEGGVLHGLCIGARLAIYPPTVSGAQELPAPLAEAHVIQSGATGALQSWTRRRRRRFPKEAARSSRWKLTVNSPLRLSLDMLQRAGAADTAERIRHTVENARGLRRRSTSRLAKMPAAPASSTPKVHC